MARLQGDTTILPPKRRPDKIDKKIIQIEQTENIKEVLDRGRSNVPTLNQPSQSRSCQYIYCFCGLPKLITSSLFLASWRIGQQQKGTFKGLWQARFWAATAVPPMQGRDPDNPQDINQWLYCLIRILSISMGNELHSHIGQEKGLQHVKAEKTCVHDLWGQVHAHPSPNLLDIYESIYSI